MDNKMPGWEEWSRLDQSARDYRLYNVLCCITDHVMNHYPSQVKICEGKFVKLEKRKWLDRSIATAVGIGTGIATALGIKIGNP